MSVSLHPALVLFVGALFIPLLGGWLRKGFLVLVPVVGFINVLTLDPGASATLFLGEYELLVLRVDRLSLLFGYLFHVAALIGAIYALGLKDNVQLVSAFLYAGSAVGVVFAGDFITLFIFWELLAITSVFQIWARRRPGSMSCGIRYLIMQISSGLLLITGAALRYMETDSLAFDLMQLDGVASYLIFLAFGIKCCFPALHTWLIDAYPEATPTGTVFLCSFTTTAAVYALARGFAGTEILVVIGTVMTMFPIFYAVIENDLRRVLGYSMINQIGFMVVGIGIGSPMAVNGAVAHAFNDVIFKGLLFMSMGAVLYRTGKINGTDLGGLYKSMPWTTGFCIVGAASISAFPLFSGFVSKSMIMAAAAGEGRIAIWLFLLFASAGVFHYAGIKIPYFAFYQHDSGIRTKEAPVHMLVAMGIAAMLCIFNGSFPSTLYSLLPYEVSYVPYTLTHIVTQTQLLFFSALAFTVLMLTRVYPPELQSVNLDFDWFYRKGGRLLYWLADKSLNGINEVSFRFVVQGVVPRLAHLFRHYPARALATFLVPYWRLSGLSREKILENKRNLYLSVQLGAFPIGITVYLAVLMLAILFLF